MKLKPTSYNTKLTEAYNLVKTICKEKTEKATTSWEIESRKQVYDKEEYTVCMIIGSIVKGEVYLKRLLKRLLAENLGCDVLTQIEVMESVNQLQEESSKIRSSGKKRRRAKTA